MPAPKTVTKVLKNGVEYTSNVDRASYTMKELSRGALRDVAKFVRKRFRESYYEHFNKRTGNAGKAVKATVYASETTIYPHVEIGLKKGKVDGFYGLFQETGTSKQAKLGLLTNAVESNVAQIIEIESKYLSGLEDEAEAQRLLAQIKEGDLEVDEDE